MSTCLSHAWLISSRPQEQRQTDSIRALGGQLENITELVLGLSLRVHLLQSQVTTPHSPCPSESALLQSEVTPPTPHSPLSLAADKFPHNHLQTDLSPAHCGVS